MKDKVDMVFAATRSERPPPEKPPDTTTTKSDVNAVPKPPFRDMVLGNRIYWPKN